MQTHEKLYDGEDLYFAFDSNPEADTEQAIKEDFGSLLEFDMTVEAYLPDPISVSYGLDGVQEFYTPSFLIRYFEPKKRVVLAEVIYREKIRNEWKSLKPKFKAARAYALKNGWEFNIYTENEVHLGVYLENVRFLLPFRNNNRLPDQADKEILIKILEAIKVTTPQEIILIAYRDLSNRAELIPTLWQLISTGWIGCDLFDKLTMSSEIWCITD